MTQQLKNTLSFTNLAPGASVVLTHGLELSNNLAVEPDIIFVPSPDLNVTATTTTVTVENRGGVVLSGSLLVEYWHSIERAFGGVQNKILPVRPYIVVSVEGGNSPPQPPFNPSVVTIFARTTGSDVTGDGTLADPYLTMQRAVRDVPSIIPPGVRYVVDITGITENLPTDYTLPAWKAPFTSGIVTVGGDNLFTVAVTIKATCPPAPLVPSTDTVIIATDLGPATSDPISGLITLNLLVARPSWGANALRGMFLIAGNEGGGQNCMITDSTPTSISLASIGPPITEFPATISVPGATLTGTTTAVPDGGGGSPGCLRAINVDSILFSGLNVSNTGGLNLPSLAIGGNGTGVVQLCVLSSPELGSNSTGFCRIVRSWITGRPLFRSNGGPVTILGNLCDTWTALANAFNFVGAGHIQLRANVFDACNTIGAFNGDPAGGVAPDALVPMTWLVQGCNIKNTPLAFGGHGFLFSGGQAEFLGVNIFGCAADGIRCANGNGWVHLNKVGTFGPANTGNGLTINDGNRVAANAATYANVNLLTGLVHQIQVGLLPTFTWAAFVAGGGSAPPLNMFDVTAVGVQGAAGSGSQLYGN